MGKLFEGFNILWTDFDNISEELKKEEAIEGENPSREDTNQGSAHPMVLRIYFSRIPNIFDQICFLFWSHRNGFMNSIQKSNKITNIKKC